MDADWLYKTITLFMTTYCFWNILTTRLMRFSTSNMYDDESGRNQLYADFNNTGIPPIELKQVRLTGFMFWKRNAYLAASSSLFATVRKVDHFFSCERNFDYCSNYAVASQSEAFPVRLERHQEQVVVFDLDELVTAYIKTDETFGSKYFLLLRILFMKVEYHFNNGKKKAYRMDWRAKWYLIERHLDNKLLYRL